MGYLRSRLNVKCRTSEEERVYREIATKEGFYWGDGRSLLEDTYGAAPCSFQIGYYKDGANEITYSGDVDFNDMPVDFTTIEASELFHNELISRRIKNGRT